jgi:hypothetical protein
MLKPTLIRPIIVFVFMMNILISGCQVNTLKAQSFVGQIPSSDIFVGVVNNKGSLTAYVCDGTETKVNKSEWFKGTSSNNLFKLSSANGASLTGEIKTDEITGTLSEANGQPISFTLSLSTGDAGVYRAELTNGNGTYIGGWIVLPNGEQRGAVSFQGGVGDAYLPKGGIVPVIKLKTASPTVVLQNNISLTASKLGG